MMDDQRYRALIDALPGIGFIVDEGGTYLDVLGADHDGLYREAKHLIGLSVETEIGDTVGSVTAVQNFGASDIIEILLDPPPAKGVKSIMIPVTKQAVLGWDQSRLVISKDFADQ